MKTSVLELGNLIQGFKLSCQTEGKSPKNLAMALGAEAGELLELFQWLTEEESNPIQ